MELVKQLLYKTTKLTAALKKHENRSKYVSINLCSLFSPLLQEYFYPKYLGELQLLFSLCGSAGMCLTLELVTSEISAREGDGHLIAINMHC